MQDEFSIERVKVGRRAKYRWQEWFESGKVVQLKSGVDFTQNVHDFRIYVYTQAAKKGYRVETRICYDTIEFKATKKQQEGN